MPFLFVQHPNKGTRLTGGLEAENKKLNHEEDTVLIDALDGALPGRCERQSPV